MAQPKSPTPKPDVNSATPSKNDDGKTSLESIEQMMKDVSEQIAEDDEQMQHLEKRLRDDQNKV